MISPDHKPTSDEDKEAFYDSLTPTPEPETEKCDYLIVHTDGSLDRARGGRRSVIEYLQREQGTIVGEMGSEHLVDMPSVGAYWMAPYDRDHLADNPVANHMVQIFDSAVDVPGECRGDVIFAPAFSRDINGDEPLSGHRLDLVLDVYAEVRQSLAAGKAPRTRLHLSEMATASRNLSPSQSAEEYSDVVRGAATEEEAVEMMREHEEQVRAGNA